MSGYKVVMSGDKELENKIRDMSDIDFQACCKRATVLLRNNARKNTPVAKSVKYKNDSGEVIGEHKGGSLRKSLRIEMPGAAHDGMVGYTVHYAPHVEYGHRQQVGRYVPVLGKRLKASFVQGQYFLRKSVEETKPEFQKDLKETLKE